VRRQGNEFRGFVVRAPFRRIITTSQNRQMARDQSDAEVDHKVNVREAEPAIRQLNARLPAIKKQLTGLRPSED
jgi:uncharacterized membrane protein